ncbi:MAG: cytochrome P450 [Deltaproteobacteria bacterium]|nr:cytochrome P450 [Deltaproteobacteria bacterium]
MNGKTAAPLRPPPSTARFHQMLHLGAEMHVLLHELLRTHGDFMRWRGFRDVYLLNHPDFIRPVLTRDYRHFSKRILDYRVLAQVMGNGLVTNDGPHWAQQRNLIQPMFGNRRVNGFDASINALTSSLMDEWETRTGGETLRIDQEMSRLTFRIVGATLFGIDLDRHGQEIAEILEVANLNTLEIRALMTLCSWVPTPYNLKWRRAMKRLDQIVYGLIRARRRRGAGDDDLLDRMIHALDEGTGKGMDEKQLRDEVVTLMLAGHETSANALAWTLYLLSTRPDVEERLVESLAATLNGAPATADDLPRIPYLKQVVQESMRLYPPVWSYSRRAEQQEEFNGRLLPAGAYVAVVPYSLHRHPEFWPDPERFDPERFDRNATEGHHPFSYLPFAAGPRTCIGAAMAMLETQLVLAQILQRFNVHMVPGHPIETTAKVTLRPRYGMVATLNRRTSMHLRKPSAPG